MEAQQPLQPTSGAGVVARIRLRPNELVIRRSRLSGNALAAPRQARIHMYVPEAFRVVDEHEIQAFIQRYDFATIVSSPSTGLVATHVPVVVRREATGLVVVGLVGYL